MSLTILLKNMIKEHNVEAVEIMIAQRHDHIVFINRIDDEIRMIRKTNPPYEAMLNPEMRNRIQSLLRMVENCINKTMRLNRDCETAAEDELHKLGNGLSRLGQREKSFKGYDGKSWEPRFLDVMT
jgi:translation initiation factor IF-2